MDDRGMLPDERDRLTRVEERLEGLHSTLNHATVELAAIRTKVDTAAGGWRVLFGLLTVAGSIGALFTAIYSHLFSGTH